jgi:hypothetical protein
MEKLKAEIIRWDGVDLDRNELRSMTCLQNVIKESKRSQILVYSFLTENSTAPVSIDPREHPDSNQ